MEIPLFIPSNCLVSSERASIKCGMKVPGPLTFVCVAAYSGVKIKDETARLIVIMIMVMTFVLPGFEHCIANGGIFTMGITQLGSTIDWSMLPLHMLISTLGNIIGGSVLLAVPIYIMFRTPQTK